MFSLVPEKINVSTTYHSPICRNLLLNMSRIAQNQGKENITATREQANRNQHSASSRTARRSLSLFQGWGPYIPSGIFRSIAKAHFHDSSSLMTQVCSSSGSHKANMLCPDPGPGPTVSSQQCTVRLQTAHSCTTCMRSSINMKRVIGSVACLSRAGSTPFLMLLSLMLLLRLFRRQGPNSCNIQAPNAGRSA